MRNPIQYEVRRKLIEIGEQYLEDQYDMVSHRRGRQTSLYDVKKGGKTLLVCLRTCQDGHPAFDPKPGHGFKVLDDVDVVVIVASDDWESPNPKHPKFAYVHEYRGEVLRDYYNRAREARAEAGYPTPLGVGFWLALYKKEDPKDPFSIGRGFGFDYPGKQVPLSLPTAGIASHSVEVEQESPSQVQAIQLNLGNRVRVTIEVLPSA